MRRPTAIEVCREGLANRDLITAIEASNLEAELVANAFATTGATGEAFTRTREHANDASTTWRIGTALAETCLGGAARDSLGLVVPVLAGEGDPVAADSLLAAFLLWILVWNDELNIARAARDAAIDDAQLRGSMSMVAHVSCVRAMIAHRCGQLDQAISDGRLALDFKLRTSPAPAVAWAAACCIEPLVDLGRLEEADAIASQTTALEPAGGYIHTLVFLQARGVLRAAQARFDEALEDLLTVGAGVRELGIEVPALTTWRMSAAGVYAATGSLEQDTAMTARRRPRTAPAELRASPVMPQRFSASSHVGCVSQQMW